VLIQLLRHSSRSIGLDKTVDLGAGGTEEFRAFKSDRVAHQRLKLVPALAGFGEGSASGFSSPIMRSPVGGPWRQPISFVVQQSETSRKSAEGGCDEGDFVAGLGTSFATELVGLRPKGAAPVPAIVVINYRVPAPTLFVALLRLLTSVYISRQVIHST
jgi:hypothetical protein